MAVVRSIMAFSFCSLVTLAATPMVPAAAPLLSPVLILVLCVLAGIATVFMLPGHREMTIRNVAGVVLAAIGLIFAASLPSMGEHSESVYFWIFSAIAITSAVRVVTHPRPVYSALYFVLTIFASAGLFVLLEAEFMAAALVIIYAGAILVTYVFVIMLASQATGTGVHHKAMADYDSHSREPAAAAAIGFALMGVLIFLIFNKTNNVGTPAGPVPLIADGAKIGMTENPAAVPLDDASQNQGTQQLGMFLFRNQSAQMDIASVILLVSMVGAIIIAKRKVHLTPGSLEKIEKAEVLDGPATPVDDNPHSIPVYGSEGRRQNAYGSATEYQPL